MTDKPDTMPPMDVYSEDAYEAAALLRDLDAALAFHPREDEDGEVGPLRSDFLYRVRDFVASQIIVQEACNAGQGMPPLPHKGYDADEWGGRSTGPFLFARDEVIAYARQHAQEQCAALVEALRDASQALEVMKSWLIGRGLGKHWEPADELALSKVDAALAAHKEKQCTPENNS